MGSQYLTIKDKLIGKKEFRIILLGVDDSGKTKIFSQLKNYKNPEAIPTIGFNIEIIYYKDIQLTIYDVGGQDKLRVLWKHHYKLSDGIIFVLDSTDNDNIEDAAVELKKMFIDEDLYECPILVMANKQDLSGAFSPAEIINKFGFGEIDRRKFHVIGTSVITGEGIEEGLDWIVDALIKK